MLHKLAYGRPVAAVEPKVVGVFVDDEELCGERELTARDARRTGNTQTTDVGSKVGNQFGTTDIAA